MCSINGFTFTDAAFAKRMNEATRHRGPDGSGVFVGDGMTLGHNRLSIIDLSERAAQPMADTSGRYAITYNGELYNFKELRAELEGRFTFRSESDTEVVLAAYAAYGAECVKKFNGIFAFAIWDAKEKTLFLARDHNGVKPLYYFCDGKRFIFASEIKAILEHDTPREVDRQAFNLYMRMLYVPEPHTMFKGIKKLPPAHYALVKNGQLVLTKYWGISDFSDISSREEAVRSIREFFDDSVRRQLISDRPVGVFLSGGMDSSAVLGAVSQAATGRVKTYSAGFDVDVQKEKFNADFSLARKTAAHYGTDHHELFVSAKDIGGNLAAIVRHLDEPNANPTAGAQFLLSRLAKERVAVVLGGDGGDELFGGYRRYALTRFIRRCGRAPFLSSFLRLFGGRRAAERISRGDSTRLFLSFRAQKEGALRRVLARDVLEEDAPYEHFARYFAGVALDAQFERRCMNTDRESWLIDESLLRTDKMTMAWGLEARVPVLDVRLTELAYRIPTGWKLRGSGAREASFQGKQIWKEAVAPHLPPHVLRERKRGWFTPMAKWVRGDLRETASEILSPAHLHRDFFNAEGVQKLWEEHLDGRRYNLHLIWAVVMWQLWYDTFIKRRAA